jgi:acyl dehydratase
MNAQTVAERLETPVLYFDDLAIGMEFTSAGRTITEADIVAFACLSGDYNALHVDREFAAGTVHGERIAHGLLVLSILSGLSTRIPLMLALGETIVGLANLECRFKRPAKIGDTIHVKFTVADLTPTSKGKNGLITLQRDAVNQRGEVVMESIWKLLIKCRAAEAA